MADALFPPGEDGRVPGGGHRHQQQTTTTRLIAHLFTAHGWRTAMTNTDGVYVNGRQIDSGDCSGPRSRATPQALPRPTPPCSNARAAACCAKAGL